MRHEISHKSHKHFAMLVYLFVLYFHNKQSLVFGTYTQSCHCKQQKNCLLCMNVFIPAALNKECYKVTDECDTSLCGLVYHCLWCCVCVWVSVCEYTLHTQAEQSVEIPPEPLKCWGSYQAENSILINFVNWISLSARLYCFSSTVSIRHTWTEIDRAQGSKELHFFMYARTQKLQRATVACLHEN